jgi:hypothetical protein
MLEKILSGVKQIITSPIFFKVFGCILLLLILILHYPKQPKPPIYNYKVVSFVTNGDNRTGAGSAKFASINISDEDLLFLGMQSWELVSSALEMETSFPNFGNSSYVTGIQSNVRPQRLICIFRRRIN